MPKLTVTELEKMKAIIEIDEEAKGLYSANDLHKLAKKKGFKISKALIEKYKSTQIAEEIHGRSTKLEEGKGHVVAFAKNDLWVMDLLDIKNLSVKNRNMKFLLNVIDVFTRKAFSVPIKINQAEPVLAEFKKIVESEGKPRIILSDLGGEFLNRKMSKYLEENGIYQSTTFKGNHHALGVIDRYTRTIKELIRKYLTRTKSATFVDNLQTLVDIYNKKPHMALKGDAPLDVEEDTIQVFDENLRKIRESEMSAVNFAVGDKVRHMTDIGAFKKGWVSPWSGSVYTIKQVYRSTATLEDGSKFRMAHLKHADVETAAENKELERTVKTAQAKRKLK